ncbi:MAG: sigma-54-dependent Fis family transcriptional regulator [Saprospiraceae bacterium]|jgi:DNA-binding NtrC family response regulator|nr:sigma-54-dependent Fis family transcriptional regulator [Saprospiraceae bacterium]
MILIIDDDIAVRTSLSLLLKKEGFDASPVSSPGEALDFLQHTLPELVILDMNFSNETSGADGLKMLERIKSTHPELPVILITGWASIDLAVKGMKLGASDFINKPWKNSHLMESVRTILQLSSPGKTPSGSGGAAARKKLDQQFDFSAIIGNDPQIIQILETIGRVAPTDAPVLIMGESGTGKELIAEAIHQNSLRSKRPFVKVNLGGISAGLFESEMFGHVRGAFTDARTDRVGRFEMTNKGSIFLDEIGDLELASQVKLLRVLQDRTYEVLGSSRTKTVDVRVISATNRNLEEMVADNQFREDLLYRINLITLKLPSLRERPGDIPLLVDHFITNLSELYNRPIQIEPEAMKWLKTLPLPGNIRQLKNLVERTVLVNPHDLLTVADFQQQYQPTARKAAGGLPEVGAMTLEEMEVQMIQRAMTFHKGKIARVAKSLGITRSALYRRLEKFGIPYSQDDI